MSKDHFKYCILCRSDLIRHNANGKERLKCSSDDCGRTLYLNPVPVAVAIIPTATGIVLIKRKNNPRAGYWALPGGFVDEGEGTRHAAIRESKEEAGVDIIVGDQPFRVIDCIERNQTILAYLAEPITATPVAGDDAVDAAVFEYDNIPELAFSSHTDLVNLWLQSRK